MSNGRYCLIIFLLFITSCAAIKPATNLPPFSTNAHQQHLRALNSIEYFALKGRLGVVTQQKGFSGSIQWEHLASRDLASPDLANANDNIQVFSPLGSQIAHIVKDSTGVTLTLQEGKTTKAPDAESLTANALGFKLPLTGLSDWVLGRPAMSKIDALTIDEQGKILTLKQDGWDINFENYSQVDAVFLPNKVLLKSEKVNLKLIIDDWTSIKN